MRSKVAYFINRYPVASHTFIRREIQAVERQGVEVLRIALRGWDDQDLGPEDKAEQGLTRYVLRAGVLPLLGAMLATLCGRPRQFLSALALAVRMSRRSERSLPFHLAYLAEACVLARWAREQGASHVHAHFGTNSAEIAMLSAELGGPPYSFTAHGSETVDCAEYQGFEEKIGRARFVVSVCQYGRSQLFRRVRHGDWHKIRIVHCGIEPAFHADAPVGDPLADRIVCVGRLCNQKGQQLLLDALRRLAAKGLKPELVLAGDGEMRAVIERLIDAHGMREQVRITGWIGSGQVRDEILAARVLVLPSFSEGLPVVLMEAMALRRPVISTFVGGIPELVQPGVNGWLVHAGSVESLAGALEEALRCEPARLAAMGEAARTRVLEQHDIDTEATKLARLFVDGVEVSGGSVS